MAQLHLPKLEPHNHEFPEAAFGSTSDLLNDLGKGNVPVAVMVTCSELAFEPDYLSRSQPGELVIIQTAGGLNCAGDQRENPSASFGNLFELQNVKHLIVCGHSECEVFNLLLKEPRGQDSLVLKLMKDVETRFREHYSERPSDEHRQILIQESVLQQLAYILTRRDVEARLRDDSLRLHAWIRDDSNSLIVSYNVRTGQFSA